MYETAGGGAVADTLGHVDIVAAVHAESSSSVLNPLAEHSALAKSRNALSSPDAVGQ